MPGEVRHNSVMSNHKFLPPIYEIGDIHDTWLTKGQHDSADAGDVLTQMGFNLLTSLAAQYFGASKLTHPGVNDGLPGNIDEISEIHEGPGYPTPNEPSVPYTLRAAFEVLDWMRVENRKIGGKWAAASKAPPVWHKIRLIEKGESGAINSDVAEWGMDPNNTTLGWIGGDTAPPGPGGGGPDTRSEDAALLIEQKYKGKIRAITSRMNSVLEERSYLDFFFPNPNAWGAAGQRRVVMWENPDITETRTPTYAQQPIVQRNEPVRLYVGSGPRKVTLRFNYTLPHIAYFMRMMGTPPVGWGDMIPGAGTGGGDASVADLYYKFLNGKLRETFGTGFDIGTAHGFGGGPATVFTNATDKGPRFFEGIEPIPAVGSNTQVDAFSDTLSTGWGIDRETGGFILDAIGYVHFMLDTVRASVMGDQQGAITAFGPPIVRFRHGTVFTDQPFIVTNYSISYPPTAGYDARTLLPRQVKVSLDMEEYHQAGLGHGTAGHTVGALGAGTAGGDFDPLPGASQVLDLTSSYYKKGFII